MVLFSCARMVLRRLALRKGLSLTAACLFLVGVVGIMYLGRDGTYGEEGGRTRTVRLVGDLFEVSNQFHLFTTNGTPLATLS